MRSNTYKLQCPCGGGARLICQPVDARRVMSDFNRRHAVCTPAARFRCGVCGCLLLGKDACPMHDSAKVAWTEDLEKAYWSVVETYAIGRTPSVPMAEAAVYTQAIDLAQRWDGHRVVALRLEEAS